MSDTKPFIHPYMPNTVPEIRAQMLSELGVEKAEDIYKSIIPDELLFKGRLDLPEGFHSEYELKKHMDSILKKNVTTEDCISFLGGGCYRHQVPALCDELNVRGEFLTGYCGDTYSDHGKMQAIFEYTSMMGELLDAEIVSYTTYDGAQSALSAVRIALRVQAAAGKPAGAILVPDTMSPDILCAMKTYCARNTAEIRLVESCPECGCMKLDVLEEMLKAGDVGVVYYESPSYLGFLETKGEEIAALAHKYNAMCAAQAEPAALGVLESPLNLGADIVCGDIQPLGMHMQYGGGQAGFIACKQNLDIVKQFPTYMYGICKTDKEGVYGWGRAMNYRSSHGSRENAKEYFGTETGLWGITAAIYLASMGPQGMYELGEAILQNARYLEAELNKIPGVKANKFGAVNFQEFVVDFSGSGKTVKEINEKLLEKKIFGGHDLTGDFPRLSQCALYCVSELTTEEEIGQLTAALREILGEE